MSFTMRVTTLFLQHPRNLLALGCKLATNQITESLNRALAVQHVVFAIIAGLKRLENCLVFPRPLFEALHLASVTTTRTRT